MFIRVQRAEGVTRGCATRQRLRRNLEKLQQPWIPIHGAQIPQQRARGIGRIGDQGFFLEQAE
ncbi:hypothetical protein D3C83_171190 [compost metagenome]